MEDIQNMNKSEVVAGTLAWCNGIRKEKGLDPMDELPQGFRFAGASCPCGKATGMFVSRTVFWPVQEGATEQNKRKLPDIVMDFVEAFDGGKFPEYEVQE
jgi:hypothetical protein